VLLSFAKIALIDTAIVANEFAEAIWLALAEVSDVAASIFVNFNSSTVLVTVKKTTFINIAYM